MSSVYRAVHVDLGHEVALKVLPTDMAKNPIVLQRFLREARSAETLEHPNIVSIYDRGIDQGLHYLVLEYVHGSDLHDYVQRRGPLSAAEAIDVVKQVAEGLRFAGVRGLVHRDIKPSNIMRSDTGEIKITDLGLALQSGFEDERVTREGTTVGTVDYMAPEQARDSRAASLQSDMYSLGCTCYYLLTGIPPYPGGDIIDKLTRHAKSPPPDVRDLRPDIPGALAAIMLRMMAKRPEDRFESFEQLIEALDGISVDHDTGSPGALLVPLDTSADRSDGARSVWSAVPSGASAASTRPPSSIPEISLANLPPELAEDEPVSTFVRSTGNEPAATFPRPGGDPVPLPRVRGLQPLATEDIPSSSRSTGAWVALSVALGAVFVFSVIVIDRVVRSSPSVDSSREQPAPLPEDGPPLPRIAKPALPPHPSVAVTTRRDLPSVPAPTPAHPPEVKPTADWTEPEDSDAISRGSVSYSAETLKKYLPDWALAPIPAKVDGPLIRVRRVAGSREPSIVSSLRMALDETKGTIEIADEGPFLINDFRPAGETRLVRAREGYRSIIRVDRPLLDVVRKLPGVISLEGKNLILDSLDIIVSVRDLPATQACLFSCTGANLTVRNCTITVVNQGSQPFSLVRAEASPSRGSRVRFERSLVRGSFSSGFDMGKGAVDLAVRETTFLGSQGPLVRSLEPDRVAERRFSSIGSILACRGPGFELREANGEVRKARPFVIRTFDTVFGRFQGAGIASVIASSTPLAGARDRVDWLGDRNLFSGWKGFYASGFEHTLLIPSLAAFRSTWNESDQTSREILAPWPQPAHLGQAVPADLGPFIPGREAALKEVPLPRPFLGAKTLWTFPEPVVPVPSLLDESTNPRSRTPVDSRLMVRLPGKQQPHTTVFDQHEQARSADGSTTELVFDTEEDRWHGDLGAFLRSELTDSVKHARIKVVGSGPHRTSPVRLLDGLVLEVVVEAPAKPEAEWLSWSPEPESRGSALLELHGGTLVLSQLRLRADESATLGSLIHVENGDLLLRRCQLVASSKAETGASPLLSFKAATTRPRPPLLDSSLFTSQRDRPVCIVDDSLLITEGAAVRAELGRGLLSLRQTAISAGTDAIELVPASVARDRFVCDLVLDRCTVASQSNIIRLGNWPGRSPGPDRPWLVTTRNCAFMGSYDRRASDTTLLRVDEDAMAHGSLFWQGTGDALEVDAFTAVDNEPASYRPRDVAFQWVYLWGANHMRDITGPHAGSNLPSVRLVDRLKPGRIEPSDLILDPDYHPGRSQLDVGADLSRQGVSRRTAAGGRRR
jgi:serine/threonine-protein kinase